MRHKIVIICVLTGFVCVTGGDPIRLSDPNEEFNIQSIPDYFQKTFQENGTVVKIEQRLKSPKSILNKLFRRCIIFDDLYDLIGIRFITTDVESCYRIQDEIVKRYHIAITKDFIRNPKSNGYQSLHTIIWLQEIESYVEIQIRTAEMNNLWESEHDLYKKKQIAKVDDFLQEHPDQSELTRAMELHEKFNWMADELREYKTEIDNLWRIFQEYIECDRTK